MGALPPGALRAFALATVALLSLPSGDALAVPTCATDVAVAPILCEGAGAAFELSAGGQAWDLDPITGTESVEAFYGYGTAVNASSNTGLEQSNAAVIALHRDPTGVLSLVLLIDAPGDGSGGRLQMNIAGLPAAASLVVEDDPEGGQDSYDMATGDFLWRWFSCCTDGMAVTDLPADLCITLDASLVQGLDTFKVLLGDGKTSASLPANGGPLTICAKQPAVDDDCDGLDDDCDGLTDEDFVVTQTTCGVGVCTSLGQQLCVGGELLDTCVVGSGLPTDTICDDVDNDCDGETDEDYVAPWTVCGYGPCKNAGQLICDRGGLINTCEPQPILGPDDNCDGIDDNCDGVPDNFCQAIPTTCGVGYCSATGIITCSMGNWLTICRPALPGIESCNNGIDDDCDGLADEEDVCECGDTLTTGTAIIMSGVLKLPGLFDQVANHTVVFDIAGGVELDVFDDGTAHMHGLTSVISGGGGPTGPSADWYLDIYLEETLTDIGSGYYAINQDISSLQVVAPPWDVAFLSGLPGVPVELTADPGGGLNFDGPVHFDYLGYRDTGSIDGSLTPNGTPGCDF